MKPSRWWRRHKSIEVTIWPRFLAQALCPHIHKNPIMWSTGKRTMQCVDCHKRIEEINDCVHGEVIIASWEDLTTSERGPFKPGMPVGKPTGFRCQHCGEYLQINEVPENSIIDLSPMNHQSNDSAAKDH
jgi:hypothetical protein